VRRLTSLLLVEERLFEAEYFALLLKDKHSLELQFHLNAFLSAARSVTFLIQKELRHVEGFEEFWTTIRDSLRQDETAKFFLELRNFSQKKGRVSLVGYGGIAKPSNYQFPKSLGDEPEMLHFFSAGDNSVPDEISNVDIVVACLRHTGKLAALILNTMDRFPYDTCPSRACSIEGAQQLGWELADFLEASGFPRDWMTGSKGLSIESAYEIVAKNFDAVDRNAIDSIAEYSTL